MCAVQTNLPHVLSSFSFPPPFPPLTQNEILPDPGRSCLLPRSTGRLYQPCLFFPSLQDPFLVGISSTLALAFVPLPPSREFIPWQTFFLVPGRSGLVIKQSPPPDPQARHLFHWRFTPSLPPVEFLLSKAPPQALKPLHITE